MKIGWDLDGTLDKPALRDLCLALLKAGVETHIITGIFDEAGNWQSEGAKRAKLRRLGIPFKERLDIETDFADNVTMIDSVEPAAFLHMLHAVKPEAGLDYRLRDLGLRKGELSERLGLDIFLDDSETYTKIMPAMNGAITILKVM